MLHDFSCLRTVKRHANVLNYTRLARVLSLPPPNMLWQPRESNIFQSLMGLRVSVWVWAFVFVLREHQYLNNDFRVIASTSMRRCLSCVDEMQMESILLFRAFMSSRSPFHYHNSAIVDRKLIPTNTQANRIVVYYARCDTLSRWSERMFSSNIETIKVIINCGRKIVNFFLHQRRFFQLEYWTVVTLSFSFFGPSNVSTTLKWTPQHKYTLNWMQNRSTSSCWNCDVLGRRKKWFDHRRHTNAASLTHSLWHVNFRFRFKCASFQIASSVKHFSVWLQIGWFSRLEISVLAVWWIQRFFFVIFLVRSILFYFFFSANIYRFSLDLCVYGLMC